MLIFASLQLVPGTFSIFYHYALGKTNAKKADDQALSFILGAEIFVSIMLISIYTLIFTIFYNSIDFCPSIFFWIMAGIFCAEAIIIFLFYYRRGKTTELFIPRRTAKTISTNSRKAKSRSDAIALGLFSNIPELIFTFPLYIISSVILLDTTAIPRALIIILYVLVSTIPLFAIRILYRTGHNLANITRLRAKLKPFFKLIIPTLYLLLAIAALNLGVLNNG